MPIHIEVELAKRRFHSYPVQSGPAVTHWNENCDLLQDANLLEAINGSPFPVVLHLIQISETDLAAIFKLMDHNLPNLAVLRMGFACRSLRNEEKFADDLCKLLPQLDHLITLDVGMPLERKSIEKIFTGVAEHHSLRRCLLKQKPSDDDIPLTQILQNNKTLVETNPPIPMAEIAVKILGI